MNFIDAKSLFNDFEAFILQVLTDNNLGIINDFKY